MGNQLKTIALLGALSAGLVALGWAVSPSWAYVGLAFALVMNVGAYFFSDRIVLAMHRARPVTPRELPWLHEMVAELSTSAGIPTPRLFVIPDHQPNAFATGRNPKHGVVAVTAGILEALDRRELRGVLAHELAHVKNRDILVSTIAATLAAAITHIAHLLMWLPLSGRSNDDERGSPAGALLLALLAPVGATLVQLGISRSREYLADAEGARISGDPLALADALLKLDRGTRRFAPAAADPATASLFIVNPFAGGAGIARLFSTHPSTAERVARLRALAASGTETARAFVAGGRTFAGSRG